MLQQILLTGLIVLHVAGQGSAVQEVRQVLVLHSFDRGSLPLDHFTGNFRVDLDRLAGQPVNFVQFVVAPAGFIVPPERAVVDFLRTAFTNRPKPDLIVTVGGPAAAFARKYRQQLFPETPLLFASFDQRYLRDAPLARNETAVAVANDFPRLVEDILRLFPQTTQLFMVMGSGQLGKFWHRELEREFQPFQNRLKFIWTDDLSFTEIVQRAASLPPHSAIFYLAFGTDAVGGAYADDRVLVELHAKASAPLFATQSAQLGYGIVGGTLMSNDDLGRRTAEVAVRILNGESPDRIRVPAQAAGPAIFDWRELRRWGISESRLPAGSIVRFRGSTLWRDYRREVLVALGVLVVQSLLIIGLLYQRRARQRAESESLRNLALAADANRRVTVSTLTGSIAHELSQPLNSILHNAQAGEMLLNSDRATPETLRDILADIRTENVRATAIVERQRTMLRNHQLAKKPIDLHAVVRESLALVARDLRARKIPVDVVLPPDPCIVVGDQVLLQQVFVNLLMNAMEAMSETPSERRQLRVLNDVRRDGIEISVRDTGTGLPANVDGKVFDPFVTTKPNGMGIGLTIARTIVEAHRGTLEAHNNPEGGATFRLTLPNRESA